MGYDSIDLPKASKAFLSGFLKDFLGLFILWGPPQNRRTRICWLCSSVSERLYVFGSLELLRLIHVVFLGFPVGLVLRWLSKVGHSDLSYTAEPDDHRYQSKSKQKVAAANMFFHRRRHCNTSKMRTTSTTITLIAHVKTSTTSISNKQKQKLQNLLKTLSEPAKTCQNQPNLPILCCILAKPIQKHSKTIIFSKCFIHPN